jgi:sugar phosphate isomerase/epimerase
MTWPVPVALQLYTVRDETAHDFLGTLRRVHEIGYRAVEFAGYGGLSAAELSAQLRDIGLEAAASHVGLDALTGDLDGAIAYCHELGCRFVVLSWLPAEARADSNLPAMLEGFGRRCAEAGLSFAYHNHDFEFQPAGNGTPMERILGTDPGLVGLEVDVYWAAYAGVDPAEFLQRHAGRVRLVHLKDMAPDRSYTEVGAGTLNLDAIYRLAAEIGADWCIVEHDQPSMPSLESARLSLENLSTYGP